MSNRYGRDGYYRPNEKNDRSYRRNNSSRPYGDYRPGGYERNSGDSAGYRQRVTTRRHVVSTMQTRSEKRGLGKKVIIVFIVLAAIIVHLAVMSVIGGNNKKDGTAAEKAENNVTSPTEQQVELSEADAVYVQAEALLSEMTTEEKVGQLLLIRSNGRGTQSFSELIAECKVGGVVLFKSDFEGKSKQGVKDMTAALQEAGGGKLLICVDEEGGTVVRMSGLSALRSEKYKSPQELYKLGGYDKIKEDTVNKCEFLKTYGVNVNFAPVADVVTEKSGFMYKRAFGKNGDATGEYVATVVSAMKENRVGSTMKHFPGYGNSKADTHEGLDHNTLSIGSLKASDLVPFEYGIKAGADSIMVTHTVIDDVDAKRPASMSPDCIALIRDYLSFDGVILTDALDMGAIIEYCGDEDPCVRAFVAGIDLLCLPSDPVKAYNNLLTAVNDGKISEERLDESVMRILIWKINLGLYEGQELSD